MAAAALLLGVVSASVCCAQEHLQVQFPSRSLELLAGPLTRAKVTSGGTGYDAIHLKRGRLHAARFPEVSGDLVGSNYYDLALTLYLIYFRTGDLYWRDRARTVAEAWRDDPLNQSIGPALAGVRGADVPPPRAFATLGLALYALETNDARARQVVDNQARAGARWWGVFDGLNSDMREASYALMAMLAATVLGDDHRTEARRSLESFLGRQKPDGRWENTDNCALNRNPPGCTPLVPAIHYTLNYMAGLTMEALILYDRVIGDPRIRPAVERCVNWTWATQWVPAAQAFRYANINSGEVNTTAHANLNGLLLPAWGYAYAKSGNRTFVDQGNQILKGLVEIGGGQIWGLKQFTQLFRSSSKYLGYLELVPGPRSDRQAIDAFTDSGPSR